eukprot:14228230-Heterocapsa_arctica.AAC.1
MENCNQRTTDMAVIVSHAEMGKVCVHMKSVADYHMRKEKNMQEHAGLPDLQSILRHAREPE